jgi:hypothetical protein
MRALQLGDVVRHHLWNLKKDSRLGTIMYISQNRERLVILFNGEEEWRWASCFELVSEPLLNWWSTPLKNSSPASGALLKCGDVVRHFKSWRLGKITGINLDSERAEILFHDGVEEWRWASAFECF